MPRQYFPALAAAVLLACASLCGAQDAPPQSSRKVLVRVTPVYPDLARRLYLRGTIKVIATVGTDGTVKDTKPVGGNPVLIQAAETALRKWKWQPASGESKELIEMSFHPGKSE